jgi:hypothetical protein
MSNFLVFSWFLTLGFVPLQYENVGKEQVQLITEKNPSTVAELGLSVLVFNRFELYTSMENFQNKSPNFVYFYPYRIDYTFGMKFRIIDGITLEAKHYCNHPVISGTEIAPLYQGYETQFTITFSGSTE